VSTPSRREADQRLEDILAVISRLATGDLKARAPRTNSSDSLDAIACGLNMLAEELAANTERLQRLDHLRATVHRLGRLMVQPSDAAMMMSGLCEILGACPVFRRAFIVLWDQPDGTPTRWAEAGWGDDFHSFERYLSQGQLPTCWPRYCRHSELLQAWAPGPHCDGCPLDDRSLTEGLHLIPVQHGGVVAGIIGVTLLPGDAPEAQEFSLIAGAAADFGIALHAMRQAELRAVVEETLSQEEAKFRSLAENTPGMVYRGKPDWSAEVMFNSESICGFTVEELAAPERTWLDLVHPDDRDRVILETSSLVAIPGRLVQEYRVVTREGNTVWVEDYKVSRFSPDGAFQGVDGIVFDITDKKRLQASLLQADRMSSVGLLAAGVAHEINNPLSYVVYNLQSISDELGPLKQALAEARDHTSGPRPPHDARTEGPLARLDELATLASEATDGALRVRDIVRDLKTFSRVEEDHLGTVDLNRVIRGAVNMAQNEIKYRARLTCEYHDHLPAVLASDGRLSQLFLNLLVNAAHAIDDGNAGDNEIQVKTWTEGQEVLAQVKDTGSGIAEEHLDQIFKPFFTTRADQGGTGLGLSICQTIVAAYGGQIEVDSERGEGSRFVVRLPAAEEQPARPRTTTERLEPVGDERPRILLVDDEPLVRKSMARLLKKAYWVEQANTGAEARRMIREDPAYDLIISDLMMPEVSGMDLHTWLAAKYPGLVDRVVFITGGAFTPSAQAFLDSIPNVMLEKPVPRKVLLETVKELVG